MGHKANFEDRIDIFDDPEREGKQFLVRVVTAHYKDWTKDVYMEYEKGTSYCDDRYYGRHLHYTNLAGYVIYREGEDMPGYYGYRRKCEREEEWANYYICNLNCGNVLNKYDEANILKIYPEFKWVLNKMPDSDKNGELVMELLERWKINPECEGLVKLGLYDVALNANLYKLTTPKRKEIIKWIQENSDKVSSRVKLVDILKMIKYNISYDEYREYYTSFIRYKGFNYPEYCYLIKKGYTKNDHYLANIYEDYLRMAEKVGHNMKDNYWHFPSDLKQFHDKVMEEHKNFEGAKIKIQDGWLKEVVNGMQKFNANVNGYDIYIPSEMKDIQLQCDELYQCLIRNDYVGKMIDQEIILVFIRKNGKPIATAEVYYNARNGERYGQFYGNESDRDNCKPSEEVKAAFETWLKTFKPVKAKFERKVKYYKSFYKQESNGELVGYGNYHFKVGNTYKTSFADDTIIQKGGKNCNASELVFHFCRDIKEISKHYNPNKALYCEVEPVGALVEYNGAYLSNKIKIVKQLSIEEIKQLMA